MRSHTNNGSSDGFETLWRTLDKAKAIAPQDTNANNTTTGVLKKGTNSISFLAFLTGFLAFLLFFFDGFAFFAAFLLAFAAFFAFAAAAFFVFAAFADLAFSFLAAFPM